MALKCIEKEVVGHLSQIFMTRMAVAACFYLQMFRYELLCMPARAFNPFRTLNSTSISNQNRIFENLFGSFTN